MRAPVRHHGADVARGRDRDLASRRRSSARAARCGRRAGAAARCPRGRCPGPTTRGRSAAADARRSAPAGLGSRSSLDDRGSAGRCRDAARRTPGARRRGGRAREADAAAGAGRGEDAPGGAAGGVRHPRGDPDGARDGRARLAQACADGGAAVLVRQGLGRDPRPDRRSAASLRSSGAACRPSGTSLHRSSGQDGEHGTVVTGRSSVPSLSRARSQPRAAARPRRSCGRVRGRPVAGVGCERERSRAGEATVEPVAAEVRDVGQVEAGQAKRLAGRDPAEACAVETTELQAGIGLAARPRGQPAHRPRRRAARVVGARGDRDRADGLDRNALRCRPADARDRRRERRLRRRRGPAGRSRRRRRRRRSARRRRGAARSSRPPRGDEVGDDAVTGAAALHACRPSAAR